MPSVSRKQAKLMAACAHGAGYSDCPPKKVAREFNQADAGTGILKRKRSKERHPRSHAEFERLGYKSYGGTD